MADTPAEQTRVPIDDSNASASYANFGRVASTPEEVILEFGLNANPPGTSDPKPVRVTERIILNHFTAKRVVMALHMAIERHEKAFGPLELDANKRVKTPAGDGAKTK